MQTFREPWVVSRDWCRSGEGAHEEQRDQAAEADDRGDLGNSKQRCVAGRRRKQHDVQIDPASKQHDDGDFQHDAFIAFAGARKQDKKRDDPVQCDAGQRRSDPTSHVYV